MESVRELYKKFYTNIHFDRSLLFRTISTTFPCRTILYPGSSIHVTPSFYFPHVVYIDKSPLARDFFSRDSEVKELINANKCYKRSSYFKFINADFTGRLDVEERSFDLLISLYSGKISSPCKQLLRRGGYLLTNNFNNFLGDILADPGFVLQAVLVYKSNDYQVIKENLEKYKTPGKNKPVKFKKDHHEVGLQFIKHEKSYLFKREKL